MIRGTYTAASAMMQMAQYQDVISNNLANLNTTGFKRDQAAFRARMDKTIFRLDPPTLMTPGRAPAIGVMSTGAILDQVSTAYSQGDLRGTDNPTDIAIRGKGFFTIMTPTGEALSRNGVFELTRERMVVDAAGNPVLGMNGTMTLPEGGVLHVSEDGTFSVGSVIVDKLKLQDVDDRENQLKKSGDSYYRIVGDGRFVPATNCVIHQGHLENSTVTAITEMVQMIQCMRTYEGSQKIMGIQDETISKAVNEIARV